MSLSISPDEIVVAEQKSTEYERLPGDDESAGPAARFTVVSRATLVGGIVLTVVLFTIGAWQRRWIADDGLIVLRTVRNLLAGNGPVFNMGERVEANTSTAWTYVVWFFSWLTQARLEYVVLAVALTASVLAVVFAMLGTARLWGGSTGQLLIPAGVLVYIALPPARDYATSGLESGLVICWVGLLWWLMIRWSQAAVVRVPSLLGLAFLAGLAPLVRPEAALIGVAALAMMFLAPMPQFRFGPIVLRALIVAVAGIVPIAYQIWRMGYYGLPYPNTAVAKDAGGAKWGQGFTYLWDLVGPYHLWIPLLVLLVAGLVVAVNRGFLVRPQWSVAALRGWLRSPSAVVVMVLGSGVLLTLYAIRVGGDFMHGRMLLTQLFLLLLPVAVVPIRLPRRLVRSASEGGHAGRPGEADRHSGLRAFTRANWSFAVLLVALLGTAGWSMFAASTTAITTGTKIRSSGIVDERVFYVLNTGVDHPIRAEDYLDYPRMRAMVADIAANPDGGLLLNSPSYTFWYVDPPPEPIPEGGAGHTVYFLNLGMTSMNVPLDVRVIDPMGLAYPLAAHSDRLEDGRIGHDKSLYPDWVVVDSGMVDLHPWMPWYMDEEWVTQARTAMSCPETQALLLSTRDPLTFDRFKHNLRNAFSFANYRIDRVPKYEIQRCGLVDPFPEPPR
ncbi:flagellar motor control protein ZomB [Nocardia mangyaensis]|uniref:flagellar motor control protein ZomB n=1 Tax=Nocardia mangyaensis TaxID=2213200 RepID=UPI002674E55C|nr:flagellar motor control protein ZomB [Nocardia mangyaensis]MDO3647593.1 flagellar motor control protein ZomB [Nocardia mangyaensis]